MTNIRSKWPVLPANQVEAGFAARRLDGALVGQTESDPFQTFETVEDAGKSLRDAGGGKIFQVVREVFYSELEEPPAYGLPSVGTIVAVAPPDPRQPVKEITLEEREHVRAIRYGIDGLRDIVRQGERLIEEQEKRLAIAQWWEAT